MNERVAVHWLCDRCGDAVVAELDCRCRQPFDPAAVRGRLREARRRARHTDAAVGRRPSWRGSPATPSVRAGRSDGA